VFVNKKLCRKKEIKRYLDQEFRYARVYANRRAACEATLQQAYGNEREICRHGRVVNADNELCKIDVAIDHS